MDSTWADVLEQLIRDARVDQELRAEATRLLEQISAGVIPSRKAVHEVLRGARSGWHCGKLESDGSCVWLRHNAQEQGLPPPQVGQRVYCYRQREGPEQQLFTSCPGFRRASYADLSR